jgi:hypothetical protein
MKVRLLLGFDEWYFSNSTVVLLHSPFDDARWQKHIGRGVEG